MAILIGALSFITIFFLILAVATFSGILKHPVDKRIDHVRMGKKMPHAESSFLTKEKESNVFSTLGERVAPIDPEQKIDSKQRLAMAGFYSDRAYFNFWGFKIALMILLPILLVALLIYMKVSPVKMLMPTFMAFGFGLFIPDLFIYWKKKNRHEQLFCGLPDALDLLVVCVESGLGLDAAMQKVSEELHMSNRVLSEEFHITVSAVRLGKARNDALHELGERTGFTDLKTLSAVLIQASKFGTSVAQALRVHSEDLRTRRRQRAEELAAKTTVKLIFPLVFFIFPSIFVVLGGPAVIRIMDTFMSKSF